MQIFYRVSGLVLLVAMSRRLLAPDIGKFFFAVSFAEAFLLLANLNLNTVLMRRVAADTSKAGNYLAGLLGFRLVSGPVYLLVVISAAMLFSPQSWSLIAAIALFTLLEDVYFVFGSVFIATERVTYAAWLGLIVELLFIGMFLFGLLRAPSIAVIVWANLLRSIVLMVASAWIVHRHICRVRISWDSAFIKSGGPFILMTLVGMVQNKISPLLLGILGDYSGVGHFEMAMMLVLASVFVPTAIGSGVFPRVSAEGLTLANRSTILRAGAAIMGLGVVAMLGVILLAGPVTHLLYGAMSVEVAPMLRSLSPFIPLNFIALYVSLMLQALHREKLVLRCLIIATVVTIAAHAVLIPHWGVYGAAYAQDITILTQSSLLTMAFLPLLRPSAADKPPIRS
jgi:O-antigen/teichoic acid export membrane protein